MFESIRKHSKIVMFLLFLLVIPSFVLVGIDRNYFSGKSPVVARVDGHDITQAEWDAAHRSEADRIRAQSPKMDGKLLDSPQARYATLERMVRERVIQAAMQKDRLGTSDVRLARALQEIPAIAALRRADGSLDTEAYKKLVGTQGMTPEGFEATIRRDLSTSQVMGGISNTVFTTDAQLKVAQDALFARREVQIASFKASDFAAKINPSDADLQAFYTANAARFLQPEQASVEYLVLDMDSVKAGITVSAEDVQNYYKQNAEAISAKEQRRASHILVSASKDMPAAERDKAKARAQDLLSQVRATPASFAAVAKKSSDDKGSGANGGDLGYFARAAMVKPFADAAFSMKKGEISDIVESEFGFHIIALNDVKVPTFEELRPGLEAEIKQQEAKRKFSEVEDAFNSAVYEQGDSLEPIAKKFKLKLQTAKDIARTPAADESGPLANTKLREQLFAADSVQNKRNTDAVEVGPSQFAAARITAYSPMRTVPFDEVRAKVRALYIEQKSAEAARNEGQARLAAWKQTPAQASGLGAALTVSRDKTQNVARQVIDAALRAPAASLPAWVGVDLGAEGFAVVKVNRAVEREALKPQDALQLRQQFVQWESAAEAQAYYETLKGRFKVQIKAPRPAADAL